VAVAVAAAPVSTFGSCRCRCLLRKGPSWCSAAAAAACRCCCCYVAVAAALSVAVAAALLLLLLICCCCFVGVKAYGVVVLRPYIYGQQLSVENWRLNTSDVCHQMAVPLAIAKEILASRRWQLPLASRQMLGTHSSWKPLGLSSGELLSI